MAQEPFYAGVARRMITPPRGIYLIGYGDRTKGNIGVHDDLTATALVLRDGETSLAIVALDLLAINEFIVDRVRARLPGTEVVLCCSHTHSGPIVYADERSPRRNQDYIHSLVENIVGAVQEAAAGCAPAEMEYAQGEADIAINRRQRLPDGRIAIGRNPEGVVDRSVQVVSIHAAPSAGESQRVRIATLINFACHGTVLGPDNLLVSADWIGAMRARVEQELGGLTLFLQGATANLNPDMYWKDPRAFEMVRQQGERVAAAVIGAVPEGKRVSGTPLRILRREVWLPLDAPATTPQPPRTYRKPLLALAGLPPWMGFLTDFLLNRRYPWRSRIEAREGRWSVPMRLNVVRIGEVGLVTMGAEVFTEIGRKVKAASPARHTLFASVTDGCIGYLPTAEAYAEGGYEVDIAPYAYRYPARLAGTCEGIALQAAGAALKEVWH